MAIKKYLDWRGYFEGLYLSWIKNLTSTLIALGGTNAAEHMGMKGVGIDLRQAGGVFVGITVWEVIRYLNAKPKPETITVNEETQFINKP